MRKVANLAIAKDGIQRCILFETDNGVYVFPCSSLEDGSSTGDHWFEDVPSAEAACLERYGIGPADWVSIPDPLPGCLDDWIAPVRAISGALERLQADGTWQPIQRDAPPR